MEDNNKNFEITAFKFMSMIEHLNIVTMCENNIIKDILKKLCDLENDNIKIIEYIESIIDTNIIFDEYCPISKVFIPCKYTLREYYDFYDDFY